MQSLHSLWKNNEGAVAPTVALALVGLIAAGGIAFDYAHMMGLHTELQDAADQSALAAASQLDGQTGACNRARAAAAGLVNNTSRFANDAASRAITVTQGAGCTSTATDKISFYQSYDRATDTPGTPASSDANAKVVMISVNPRRALFALTPIMGLFDSGNLNAQAVASLDSAICKTPPVMMCNPAESASNSDENLQYNPTRGIGLRLITGDATVPGNFGWLQAYDTNGNPISGANNLKEELGYNTPIGDCQPVDGVTTKTGMDTTVLSAFNTRFDVYASGNNCPGGGTCSPAINTRKDLVCRPNNTNTACQNNASWGEANSPYHPTSTSPLPTNGSQDPSTMGYPMDLCHAVAKVSNTCGVEGTGTWDRDAYFRVNYGWDHSTWTNQLANGPDSPTNPSSPSRFEVYKWEQSHQNVGGKGIAVPKVISATEAAFSKAASGNGSGIGTPDRREISVAVLNCHALGLHGSSTASVANWLNVFLVQPAFQRGPNSPSQIFTDQKDIYVEVVDSTKVGTGNGLVVRRDVPYLIK